MKPEMTPQLARAIAQDAANRQMRKAGRTAWSRKDYALACRTLETLLASLEGGKGDECKP